MSMVSRLVDEIAENGKFLVGYLMLEIPHLTSFPGLITAVKTVAVDGTPAAFIDLGAQLLLAIAAGHRTAKIVTKVVKKEE